ncbi:hypothetical protein [Streptomyces candidus]|uniref:Uncharacterized protein n=1 Tax=Streptomyces candidus TaxID=67283 RepID=A0A7X0HHF8_9ACTN|nr:hypothetical protein [Streptomyces candidus]MBB6437732.1 hypothetical protein [Streptomyces candidus]GHH50415.1 hypothetical protein GCM10018773_47400 [Streptomyces candidus]
MFRYAFLAATPAAAGAVRAAGFPLAALGPAAAVPAALGSAAAVPAAVGPDAFGGARS